MTGTGSPELAVVSFAPAGQSEPRAQSLRKAPRTTTVREAGNYQCFGADYIGLQEPASLHACICRRASGLGLEDFVTELQAIVAASRNLNLDVLQFDVRQDYLDARNRPLCSID
jgi:hypothetical protein